MNIYNFLHEVLRLLIALLRIVINKTADMIRLVGFGWAAVMVVLAMVGYQLMDSPQQFTESCMAASSDTFRHAGKSTTSVTTRAAVDHPTCNQLPTSKTVSCVTKEQLLEEARHNGGFTTRPIPPVCGGAQ